MAMIRCGECGRAISDRASHCVGCGAPTTKLSGVDWVPQRSTSPMPSPRQLWLRGTLATGMLVGGPSGRVRSTTVPEPGASG